MSSSKEELRFGEALFPEKDGCAGPGDREGRRCKKYTSVFFHWTADALGETGDGGSAAVR